MIEYLHSELLYIGVGLVSIALAVSCCKMKNKFFRIAAILILIFVVSVLQVFRSSEVGIDTSLFYPRYQKILDGANGVAWYGWNPVFNYLISSSLRICGSVELFLAIIAILTNTLIISRLFEMRKAISFPFSVALFFLTLYFLEFNIFRQMLSISIVFFSTRYLEKKKFIVYAAFMLVAIVIHTSSVLGLIIGLVSMTTGMRLTRRNLPLLVMLIAIGVFAVFGVLYFEFDKVVFYFSSPSFDFGLFGILRIAILFFNICVPITVFGNGKTRLYADGENEMKSIQFRKKTLIIYVFGLSFALLGYLFQYMDRIGLVFMLFECVFWSYEFKRNKNNVYPYVMIILLVCAFILDMQGNGQGQMPYSLGGLWKVS